jgi:hypothetical protein
MSVVAAAARVLLRVGLEACERPLVEGAGAAEGVGPVAVVLSPFRAFVTAAEVDVAAGLPAALFSAAGLVLADLREPRGWGEVPTAIRVSRGCGGGQALGARRIVRPG